MRLYEIVFIVHPELDDSSFNDIIEKVKGWINEAGGSITKEEVWGKRRLAYEIRKQREGNYVLINAQLETQFIQELERNFKLTEPVIRYLIIKI